jgi:hypothetical protein
MSSNEGPWRFVRVEELADVLVRVKVVDTVIGLFDDRTRCYAAYEAESDEDDVTIFGKLSESTYLRETLGVETADEKAARLALDAKHRAAWDAEEIERCRRKVAEYDAKQAAKKETQA